MYHVAGSLEVSASVGRNTLRVRTDHARYDDGQQHAVRITRAHKRVP